MMGLAGISGTFGDTTTGLVLGSGMTVKLSGRRSSGGPRNGITRGGGAAGAVVNQTKPNAKTAQRTLRNNLAFTAMEHSLEGNIRSTIPASYFVAGAPPWHGHLPPEPKLPGFNWAIPATRIHFPMGTVESVQSLSILPSS
jgi:hypothetical protein